MEAHSSQLIRFGPFEVNTRSGELRRKGLRINLQDQPFQVLSLLLERPGEMVTREELSRRLWPENSFVDLERGLNKAINKLRVALRDNSGKPNYIETLPHRGYRFIAPVENLVPIRDRFRPLHAPQIRSLAVLPLDDLSGDPTQEYFSIGLTEELICAIARIASLRVISRTSVMSYRGTRKSLPEIAKELGVDAIVEGSVAKTDQKVRVTVQLILASEDRHLWSGRYERNLREILQLQAEVAQSIANQIQKMVDPEHAYPERARQVHPQAYEACLKGNFLRDRMTPADIEKSIEFFHRAIELDPAYARAHGDLARAYFYLGLFTGDAKGMFPKAKLNAEKALELDEKTASAHIALSVIHIFYEWDWAAAEAESRRAVELSPGESVTHAHFADYLSIRGRHSEAIAAFDRVLELDPISRVYLGLSGLILYRARRYDESIVQCQNALEIDPQYANGMWFLALSLEQRGDVPGAIAKLETAVNLSGAPHFKALLGRLYALAGEKAMAMGILQELAKLAQLRHISPFDLAVVHAGLGDEAAAFECFEEAFQQRALRIIELTMPMFDTLRPNPRWQDLVRRLGLMQ